MSDSSRPHGLQPTRLLHPWDFPGKSTGVGCHCLLHLTTYLHVNATKLIVYLLLEALGTHFSEPTKCGSEDINCYNYQHIFDPLPTQRRESLLCCSLDPSRGLWAPDQIYGPGQWFPWWFTIHHPQCSMGNSCSLPDHIWKRSSKYQTYLHPFDKQVNPF